MRQGDQDGPAAAATSRRAGHRPGDGARTGGPILVNSRGARMDRHAATRRRHGTPMLGVPITGPHPRMLRHTFVTTMLDAGVDCGTSRSPPATPIRAPQCAMSGPARTSIATRTTSWPPTWPPAHDRDRLDIADERAPSMVTWSWAVVVSCAAFRRATAAPGQRCGAVHRGGIRPDARFAIATSCAAIAIAQGSSPGPGHVLRDARFVEDAADRPGSSSFEWLRRSPSRERRGDLLDAGGLSQAGDGGAPGPRTGLTLRPVYGWLAVDRGVPANLSPGWPDQIIQPMAWSPSLPQLAGRLIPAAAPDRLRVRICGDIGRSVADGGRRPSYTSRDAGARRDTHAEPGHHT